MCMLQYCLNVSNYYLMLHRMHNKHLEQNKPCIAIMIVSIVRKCL